MHTSERGAAHINIFFFLVMLVLFLGALGFGYVQLTDNTEIVNRNIQLVAQNKELQSEVQIRNHLLEETRKVVGEGGTYAGRDGFSYDPIPQPLENVSVPTQVDKRMQQFAGDAGIPGSTASSISGLLSQAKQRLDIKEKEKNDIKSTNASLQSQITAATAARDEADRLKTSEVAALNQEKSELQQYIEAEFNKMKSNIVGLQEEVRKRDETLDSEKRDRQTEVTQLNKDKNLLKSRIDAAAQKIALVNPPMAPDGRIISSSQAAGKAWVNLGIKDMLPRGTVFRITNPKGALKARGRVENLEKDRAEVIIFDLADRFDPVVMGDLVSNDLYSPRVRRNIYLMGRFSYPMNKPTVKIKLEQLGNKVIDKIGPGVDLVLVGGDSLNETGDGFTAVTDTDEYKTALFLGIEIATLSKVRDFLQMPASEE